MQFSVPTIASYPSHRPVNAAYRADEATQVAELRAALGLTPAQRSRIEERARALVSRVRGQGRGKGGLDAFLHEYSLSSREGVALMCLAEALIRVPDTDTAAKLIRDKLGGGDWAAHREAAGSLFVNASTWALMLTGRFIEWHDDAASDLLGTFRRLAERSGEPLIRRAATQAMHLLGRQFVMGRTIEDALARAGEGEERRYRHSYDMLGEAARTAADAERYFERYRGAIRTVGAAARGAGPQAGPGISVKLSALHPRFELAQYGRLTKELLPRLRALALDAKRVNIGLTVDAEEAERLDLTLDMVAALLRDSQLAGWRGLGLAVQAYQKRACAVLDLLAALAREAGRRLMVRLVKGAYWDSEIKVAQIRGLDGYPVFTRKVSTDLSYLACARRLLGHADVLFPQFATHNAHTIAAVLELAGSDRAFEFQRLRGMGQALYAQVRFGGGRSRACRVYDPVGAHEDLVPYLVRRLLENGANTSFVNRLPDERLSIEEVVADPLARLDHLEQIPHPRIALPRALFLPDRINSRGPDLSDTEVLRRLSQAMDTAVQADWEAGPIVGGQTRVGQARDVFDPSDRRRRIGRVSDAAPEDCEGALALAVAAAPGWDATPVDERAACLERAAELLEAEMGRFLALCAREGGKLIPDAVNEVREAADFCRYYAARARATFPPVELPSPAGERNLLSLHGRGVFACISPWNFPLAIFTGQVAAALAAGNAVVAKPAEQTPLVASHAVALLHQAGVPRDILHLLSGGGLEVGLPLVRDRRVSGVAFTGSVETAWAINRVLAKRAGPIVPFIAETGGQNALIADSTALPEQLVADVVTSAFQSAGQRCSALRVLFLQEEIADSVLRMLAGAMSELTIGDPWQFATDVGPVIDRDALDRLEAHARRMEVEGRLVYCCPLPVGAEHGTFFPPQLFEISDLAQLRQEVFGPVLHAIRYRTKALDRVIDAINETGYGLTFGIHSRIDRTVDHVAQRVRTGNAYVNRSMIGAVVGVQPFGGLGLSGTGPKAGGPRYLDRFATERTLTVNTAAAGGNTALLALADDDP